jgi:hypothetical protein
MPIAQPTTTLQAIQNKVRRLTRSPSTAQLTDSDLQNYINTFVVYDFPEHLRTFNLRTVFSFYANPYQDTYPTDQASFGDPIANPSITSNPLYNFQNNYLTVHPPIYVAGYQTLYTQSREQFYGYYPNVNSIASINTTGDGITTTFTGVINAQQSTPGNVIQQIGIVQGQVLFDSLDVNFNGLTLQDVPVINPTTGNPTTTGNLYDPNTPEYQQALANPPTFPTGVLPNNNVNYATGNFTITFTTPPGPGQMINSQTINQVLSRPQQMLFYANTFILRPIPDQPYKIDIEAYKRPTALLDLGQSPELEEYWQYIAFSSAKKILEDRMDMDSVQLIMPALKEQERLMQRRTIVQYTNERVATIYTEQTSPTTGGFGGFGGGGSNV